jgi:CheY-like chemotaxis protein
MLQRLIGEDIALELRLDRECGRVKSDPGQVDQVIMNLAVNARDAMPHGGKLTIETANVTLGQDYAQRRMDGSPGDYVMLAITDTGEGMSQEVKTRLFEPFFTTKPTGKGTGLGLATCHGIVKQSGGHISVYSEEGHGTTFKVYLPRVHEEIEVVAKTEQTAKATSGAETLLLVEDEPVVRQLAGLVLRKQGYEVLEAADGEQALQVAQTSCQGGIDLLITDLVMPQMGGKELADRLRAARSDLKVLFCSGYTQDAIIHNGILEDKAAFLQKPYTPTTLAQKVREVIDCMNN